jgi:hypothetical protein
LPLPLVLDQLTGVSARDWPSPAKNAVAAKVAKAIFLETFRCKAISPHHKRAKSGRLIRNAPFSRRPVWITLAADSHQLENIRFRPKNDKFRRVPWSIWAAKFLRR